LGSELKSTADAAGHAVAAQALTKRYGRRRGVQEVSFSVRHGEICALLGPNGAGKTTTMRLLVGLSRPDRGAARLLGQPSRLAADVLARVGVLIDGPAFVPHLSGLNNLRLLWRAGGRAWPPPALDGGLALAGLGPAIDRKVKAYSTGMRQRLALVQALMGDPEVLVLDEPANGLDPGEVRALREHLAGLAHDGAAILVSSHLVAEVEVLASHVVVIDGGAAVAAIPVLAGLTTASQAGGRNGTQVGLYGAASFSALNHAAASLQFIASLPLALVVALLGSALGAADRDWGTLRYLYVQPVSRGRLLLGKWTALAVCCGLATACVLVAALLVGLAVFGWHPFHRLGAASLSSVPAAGRLLAAGGYVTVCMLSIGTIALALGFMLPGPAEALGVSVALVVIANILDGQAWLHTLAAVLPVHYWQRWTHLLEGSAGAAAGLATGTAVQAAAVAIALGLAWAVLTRRDPAA
jgi:ABC-type multidrug transport system ATPase subunit